MSNYKTKKAKLLKIKSAISEFIINAQKLVKTVEPDAEIIIPKRLQEKRKRNSESDLPAATIKRQVIVVPEFSSKRHLGRDQKK
jgi:hypothetical protein